MTSTDTPAWAGTRRRKNSMNQMSYLQFENEMRGSREDIATRLEMHRTLVTALRALHNEAPVALDIGSGRGEWLELMQQEGWNATGVDSDPEMIALCQQRGLNVIHTDARSYLDSLPAHSVDMISAFHVVEHIAPSDLDQFMRRCERALKPHGILLLETPNPQNLLVGASEFYVDPTHMRPIPPKLLDFLVRDAGFESSRILFINGRERMDHFVPLLSDALLGVGYDYVLIAQKAGPNMQNVQRALSGFFDALPQNGLEQTLTHFDTCMSKLYQMAVRDELEQRVLELEAKIRDIAAARQRDVDEAASYPSVLQRITRALCRWLK